MIFFGGGDQLLTTSMIPSSAEVFLVRFFLSKMILYNTLVTKVFPTSWCPRGRPGPLPLKKSVPFRYEFYIESLVNEACKEDQNTVKIRRGRTVSKWRPKKHILCPAQNFKKNHVSKRHENGGGGGGGVTKYYSSKVGGHKIIYKSMLVEEKMSIFRG